MPDAVFYRQNKCNLRCKHCGVGDDLLRKRSSLSLEETQSVLNNLKKNGTDVVTILGGEPFLDPQLRQILDYAESIGLGIALNTNLTQDADFELICKYRSLRSIIVSIDGHNAKTHDSIRGRGSFERAVDNLGSYNKFRRKIDWDYQKLEVSFVLNGMNADGAEEIFSFCIEKEVDVLHFNPVHIVGFAEKNSAQMAENVELRRRALEHAILFKYLFKGKLDIAMNIPPKVANYMKEKYGFESMPFSDACGGCSIYSYVDMHGNNLPCPAMAFEESQNASLDRKVDGINLAGGPTDSQQEAIFTDFEFRRVEKSLLSQMEPCNRCSFRSKCSPCVSDLYRGKAHGVVEICKMFEGIKPDRELL